ncbi:MAG: ABC transporter permease subunit, partial [Chloroflexales bacterium]|nr:ABC transporter permease subunit [Chloroflexales bacterium]
MRVTRGLRPTINPIIVREVRTRMRGARPYAILTVFLVLLALAGFGIYQLMLQQARFGGMLLSAQVGQALFRGLAFVELMLVVFLAPSMTSGAISGEREHLTYELLMATPLRPGQILWGKLVAALSYLFLLIFAAIPVFSVVLVFGGVELRALLKALALLVASAVCFGAIGLFCSALMRRTARATTIAYTLLLLLVGVPVLIASVWGQFTTPPGQQAPPAMLYLNPFSALLSVTTVAVGGDPAMSAMPVFGFGDPFGGLPLLSLLGPGVVYYGPAGPVVIPIYRATLICYGLLTAL